MKAKAAITEKERLQNELKKIAKMEQVEMIEKYYPEFKAYEGRFFKYKNCYSCPSKPSDYWWMYTKVTDIKREDIYDTNGNGVTAHYGGWTFQTCKYGQVTIEKEKRGYIHGLGQEITETEFVAAWNKTMDYLDSLK